MKIAQVSHRFLPNVGGVERHVSELSQELARRGHEVAVFSSDDVRSGPNCPPPDGRGYDVRLFRTVLPNVPGFDRVLLARGLYRALKRERPDLIHAHSYAFYSFNAAWLAAKRLGVPLVCTPHYWPTAIKALPWPFRRALASYDLTVGRRVFAKQATAVCAVGHTEARILRERFGVPSDLLHWTPNGVHPSEVAGKPGFAETHGIDGRFVLSLGRLSTQKGVHHLIRVAPELEAPVVIAGPDWGEGARLKELAKKKGADRNIRFLGAIPRDMALSAMREASAFAMPSHWEALSITLLEAWANRAAVAASDAGGMGDVVQHEVDGLVHPVGDERGLARDLNALLADAGLRQRLGKAGYSKVNQHFTWAIAADRVEEAYGLSSPKAAHEVIPA